MSFREEVSQSLSILYEMLRDRGEHDIAEHLQHYGRDEVFNIIHSSAKQTFVIDLEDTYRIIYNLQSKFRLGDIKAKYIEEQEDKFKTFIIVVRDKVSVNDVKNLSKLLPDVQVFELRELQFNISKHILVPKHELITDENEINDLVTKYCIKSRSQFPLILKTDPMAKYLHAKPGNLVKITRPSVTSGETIVYRCCV
jgi:DNA-directed RNA polymerase subunit H (RpoH/RPB5)